MIKMIKKALNELDELACTVVTEMEGGVFVAFFPEDEDATAPEACFLKQEGDQVHVFRDSERFQLSLYERIIEGELLEPDEILLVEELSKLGKIIRG